MSINQVSTLVLVEDGEGGGGGAGVPQPHGPVGRAGEEALVHAAVNQTPDRVGVSAQLSTQHGRVCGGRQASVRITPTDPESEHANGRYHRSRRGRR